LEWLKTALIIVGVLRGSTRRTFLAIWVADGVSRLKVGSTNGSPTSLDPRSGTLTNCAAKAPMEEATSLVSARTCLLKKLFSSGSASWWKGKSVALRV
jgi:hypothetical protein